MPTMGAPPISVEQVGKNNIVFWNAAGLAVNLSYYFAFIDFYNSCIHFVFSSLYLYRYPSTNGITGRAACGA